MHHHDPFRGCVGPQGKNYFDNTTENFPSFHCVEMCFNGINEKVSERW